MELFFLRRLGLDWDSRAPLLLRPNDDPRLGPPRLAHLKAAQYVELHYLARWQFDDYYKFAFVRNPWDRALSLYRFLSIRSSFRRFVLRSLPRLLDRGHWFVGPQRDYLYDAADYLLVDFVGHFENLQADFDGVCARLGIQGSELPHANASRPSQRLHARLWRTLRLGSGAGSDGADGTPAYRAHYDAQTAAVIGELYEVDVAAFGYSF